MDFGTVLSVIQTLMSSLQCSHLKEMCSFLGYKSQLENLELTVNTVKQVLLDAEAQPQELSNQAQRYIEELKDAVYDADDLLDKFVTLAERKQKQLLEGRNVSKKVRCFFSSFKDLGVAYSMSQGVKEVRKRLDAIASNHNQFGFKLDSHHIRTRRKETCSYVNEQNIVGRENDREDIVGMLLDGSVQRDVSFLSIVGMGGLGKTALAQLVYNDERITKDFGLRLWACVSDQDQEQLDVGAILVKILESATGEKKDGLITDQVQRKLRKQLTRTKYLLVLDDVWNENRGEWLELEDFFRGGLRGSWVVVTTRSRETARIVGDGSIYELQGLSHVDSWHLFERIAFGRKGQANPHKDLVKTGQEILKKCANVPLAIKVVGSLLYGQGKEKWQSFQKMGLTKIRKDENGILPILKLSYDNLESPLKSCFSYCAIFPKDFVLEKEMLISLWMAQGYIMPLDEGQSMEDAAEEYFSILLRRCFFQDVEEDEHIGGILSCKMHDLMHDIAQKVAEKELYVVNTNTSGLDKKTRHIFCAQKGNYTEGEGPFSYKIGIRTCLLCDSSTELPVDAILANWMCLRTLDLNNAYIKILPGTLGKMLHLRYLDLSNNSDLEVLPKSITKLHNLQTLNLSCCCRLIELPNDLSKLVNLRLLDINGCSRLTHMPPDMGKLSCLQWLKMFVVGEANSSSKQGVVNQLEDLQSLTNLKGQFRIRIKVPNNAAYVKESNSDHQGGYLRSKQHLDAVWLKRKNKESEGKEEYEEALLEDLQPHPNLRGLRLDGYCGMRMPSWMKEASDLGTVFPNLVVIFFGKCHGLQHLMSLKNLPHLRVLLVRKLTNLEYMEDIRSNTSSSDAGASFFPSLKELCLEELPKLKGRWRDDHDQGLLDDSTSINSNSGQPRLLPSFPRLSELRIWGCPELTRIPLCPNVEELTLRRFDERLQVIEKTGKYQKRESTSCSSSSSLSPPPSGNSKLRKVDTDNVRCLKSVLSVEAFQCLTVMTISYDAEVESLEEVGEVFQSCSSSLHSLEIGSCNNLSLSLSNIEEEDNGMPWRCLHQSLRSLNLFDLPKMVKLPKGMQYLTSLQSLKITNCKALESLPEWMPSLTSLTRLEVEYCTEELMQRCQSPTGKDWPHIQHIHHVVVTQDWIWT